MQILSVLAVIGIIICMIINLVIYHKIFSVTYFDLGRGCLTELFFAWFVAMFEVGIIGAIGKYIGAALFKLLGFAGKLILIILAIALVVFIIWKIVQIVKGKVDTEEENKVDGNPVQSEGEMNEKRETRNSVQDSESTDGDENTEKEGKVLDIELVESNPNEAKGVKAVREMTGLGLMEAKNFVDSSTKTLKRVSKEKTDNIKTKLKAESAKVISKFSQEQEDLTEKQSNIHMIACISCGKMIDENVKFCNFCGSKIIKVDMIVCTNCGKSIPTDVNFCHYCGEKVRKDS